MTTISVPAPAPAPAPAPPSASASPPPPKQQRRVGEARRDARLGLLLIVPAAMLELVIHIIPMMIGGWIAFHDLDQRHIRNWTQAPFVALDNFTRGLDPGTATGAEFFATAGRTALYVVIVLAFTWVLGMAAAVFLSSSFRGRGILRTLFLVPYAIPMYVGCIAWAFMFNQRDGMVNTLLSDLGLIDENPFWLIGDNAFFALVVVSIWSYWPFAFLMLLAALQNVPQEAYEAAALDGASNWRQFWHITLPMVSSANGALILLMGLWLFNQFTVPFVLFGPASPEQAMLVSPLIFSNSFLQWDFGLGGAMSLLLLLALLAASAVYIRIVLPKVSEDD